MLNLLYYNLVQLLKTCMVGDIICDEAKLNFAIIEDNMVGEMNCEIARTKTN